MPNDWDYKLQIAKLKEALRECRKDLIVADACLCNNEIGHASELILGRVESINILLGDTIGLHNV